MAIREFDFIVGGETGTLPTAGTPTNSTDLVTLGYAQSNFTAIKSFLNVKTVAQLQAVAAVDRQDGSVAYVTDGSSRGLYVFDSASSLASGANVIVPSAGTGRWLRTETYGNISYENVVNGTAVQTALTSTYPLVVLSSGGTPVTTIQGITQVTNKSVKIINLTGATVTIEHESGSASATNRVSLPNGTNLLIFDKSSVELIWLTTASRWVLAGGSGGGGGAFTASNTRASGLSVSASTTVSPSFGMNMLQFVVGNGGAVTVTATPPISTTSMVIGQVLTLIGTSDTNTVTYNSGNNLRINGAVTLGKDDSITLMYCGTDGSNLAWVELNRSV